MAMKSPPRRRESCSFSGRNMVHYDADVQTDEELDVAMVLDVEAIKEKYRAYRLYHHGYSGLFLFLIFAVWYISVLAQQDHEPFTGQANSGIKDMFTKAKADLKVTNALTAWKFMGGKIVPMMMGVPWESARNNEKHHDVNMGHVSFGYFYNVGGLAITAAKDQQKKCFRGQECFSLEPLMDPFYELTLPGGKTFNIPYNAKMGGYTVGLPTSTTPANIAELLTGYAGLFGPDTREIHLQAILFNPSGTKTISSVRFSSEVSVRNQVSMVLTLETIPYHLYSEDPQTRAMQVASQILMICFTLVAFVKPFVYAKFCEPKFHPCNFTEGTHDEEIYKEGLKRLAWLDKWKSMPVGRDGEVLWTLPLALIMSITCAVLFWINLVFCYQVVGDFGANDLDHLFEDPLAAYADADLHKKMTIALESLGQIGFPLMEQAHDIADMFSLYFMLQTVIVVMMMLRFLEYLGFQKRLSMVTDTFSDISHEFAHIFFSVCVVCFSLGAMYSLTCGALDPPFESFGKSFFLMLEVMFTMFKPAAATRLNIPPQKYSPHTLIGNEYLSWAPLAILLIFKILVTLLLFKLLMGVIMQSYKKSEKKKKGAKSVGTELCELWAFKKYYYWNHKVWKEPYVGMEHLVLALSNIEFDADQPWRNRFVGFGNGPESVVRLLNNIIDDPDDFSRPRLKAVVDHHRVKKCGWDQALFCMRVFGKNRDIAKYEFRDWIIKSETQKFLKQFKKNPDQKADIHTQADHHAHILLNDVVRRLAEVEQRGDLMSDFKKEKIGHEEVDMVFDAYDFYQLGQVDTKFMKCALAALGFSLPPSVIRHLIKTYDSDENQCLDRNEFKTLLKDPCLLGRRGGANKPVKEQFSMQNMLVQQVSKMSRMLERGHADHLAEGTFLPDHDD